MLNPALEVAAGATAARRKFRDGSAPT